jgi:hypothetical protein
VGELLRRYWMPIAAEVELESGASVLRACSARIGPLRDDGGYGPVGRCVRTAG